MKKYTIVAWNGAVKRRRHVHAETLADAIRQAETLTAVNIRSTSPSAVAWRGRVELTDKHGFGLATISEPVAPYQS